MPNNPNKLLRYWYGDNYMIPDVICDNNFICDDQKKPLNSTGSLGSANIPPPKSNTKNINQ